MERYLDVESLSMGEWLIPKTHKFPRWMLDRLALEQGRLAPFARTESETLRLLLDFAFSHIDRGSLNDLLSAIQGLQHKTVYVQGMTLDSSQEEGVEEEGLPTEKFRVAIGNCRQAQVFRPIQPTLFGFQVPRKAEIALGGGHGRPNERQRARRQIGSAGRNHPL